MLDSFGRTLDYLRVSLTDRCNLRCNYCMPAEGVPAMQHCDILTLEEMLRLCRVFASLGVAKIKVTGGEPLVRLGATGFIGRVKQLEGIRQVTLTTNGVLLEQYLPELVQGGIDSINVSLDTLRPATFAKLTGQDELKETLAGIRAAVAAGIPVKLNTVPLRDVNIGEYAALAGMAKNEVQAVRFIELMPIGLGAQHEGVPLSEVKRKIEAKYGPLQPSTAVLGNGPAEYYSIPGFAGKVGFIEAVSHEFCSRCNRLRLTADGTLKLCLAREDGTDLKTPLRAGASDEELKENIQNAVLHKPLRHGFEEQGAEGGQRGMYAIGG